jgi:putative spermidine/putrescine transport system ATP-binding protein
VAETEEAVRCTAVTKEFGTVGIVRAVDAVDLALRAGEFFSLLGPSGSGAAVRSQRPFSERRETGKSK